MSEFYRDDQVRGAQTMLAKLQQLVPSAVILGGWAVYLYAQGQRSSDVDIAVDFESFSRLQRAFPGQISKNNNLRKYELKADGVEVDILVVHFSNAGIPVEHLIEPTQQRMGFRVMSPEGLLAMKLCAWIDRSGRPKGDKDEADVLSLLSAIAFDWDHYQNIITHADAYYAERLPGAVARLVSSAELRRTWQFVKVNGQATVTSQAQWKALKQELAGVVPRGL
ncbi:MAG: hypothetical protein ACP5VP_02400 [Candidatus Limnocylindrales bacterium]